MKASVDTYSGEHPGRPTHPDLPRPAATIAARVIAATDAPLPPAPPAALIWYRCPTTALISGGSTLGVPVPARPENRRVRPGAPAVWPGVRLPQPFYRPPVRQPTRRRSGAAA